MLLTRGASVIVLKCEACGRMHRVAPAIAGLPLMCKSCSGKLVDSGIQDDAGDEPIADVRPTRSPVTLPDVRRDLTPKPLATPKLLTLPKTDSLAEIDDDDAFLSAPVAASLDLPLDGDEARGFEASASPPTSRLPNANWEPAAVVAPKPPTRSRSTIGIVVDGAVLLVLMGVGVWAGELAARKSTAEVMAGFNGPKFPQMDLLVWIGPPLLLVLVYCLMIARRASVGQWLARRSARPQ